MSQHETPNIKSENNDDTGELADKNKCNQAGQNENKEITHEVTVSKTVDTAPITNESVTQTSHEPKTNENIAKPSHESNDAKVKTKKKQENKNQQKKTNPKRKKSLSKRN